MARRADIGRFHIDALNMKSGFAFGIAARLYALSATVILALGGLAWYAHASLNEASVLAARTENDRVPQLQAMSELKLNVTQVSLQIRHTLLARTPAE